MNMTRRQALKTLAALSAAAGNPSDLSAAVKGKSQESVPLVPCSDHIVEIVKTLMSEVESERGYPYNPATEFLEVGCPASIAPVDFFSRLRMALPPNIRMVGWYFTNGKCPMPDLDPHCISVRIEEYLEPNAQSIMWSIMLPANRCEWKTYNLGPNSWIEENINA